MGFRFADSALVTPCLLSQIVFNVDDATKDLTPPLSKQNIALVELAVNAASNQIIRYCDTTFKRATYTEIWDGAASDELVPRERPILPGTMEIKIAADGNFSSSSPYPSNMVTTDGKSIMLRGDLQFPRGRGLIQVKYDAGYDTVPYDVQIAVIMQFQYLYRQGGRGDPMAGLKSIAKMNESQTKDDSLKEYGLRQEVVGMLKDYRRFEAPLSIMFSRVS